ncbi:MAG: hypothetical protein KBS66_02720 [Eubacterium sp.]|nr:hypothetical protein [Candidatus Colimonas fimequi]
MITQGEAVRKMQGILTGNEDTISKAEATLAVIELDKIIEGVSEDKAAKCKALYAAYMARDEQVAVDGDQLVDMIDVIKADFDAILSVIDSEGELFNAMLDSVQEFLFNPPFEGYDSLPYGLIEIGVWTLLDFYLCKEAGYDRADYHERYRNSVASRSNESNADYHMEHNVCKLQTVINKALIAAEADTDDTKLGIACILTLTNIKTPEMLEMVAMGAPVMAREIVPQIKDPDFEVGGNDMTDNVFRLYSYIRQALEELQLEEAEV